jgi:XTP/dITP diphosphohydrolase
MERTVDIVVASANPKKIEELRRLLPEWVNLVGRPQEVADIEETAPTLEGNAYIKAVEIANFVQGWALADDTGLCVDALDGAPGVFSARYGGPECSDADNRRLLLKNLERATLRTARFRTVIALVHANGEMHHLWGDCEGTIAEAERGVKGFGYDCVFVPDDGDGRTFAEMSAQEKDLVSHRGRAMAQLPELLSRIFGLPTA